MPVLLSDGAISQVMLVSSVLSGATPSYKQRTIPDKQPLFVISSLALALLLSTPARAEQAQTKGVGQSACQARDPFTGTNTSRLSGKMLNR